jgi:hypothetical protein
MVVERIIKKGIRKRKGKKKERRRKEKGKGKGKRRDYLSTVFNRARDNIRRFNRM